MLVSRSFAATQHQVSSCHFVCCRKIIREDGVDMFVELDVGSDYNSNEEQIRSVLYNVVNEGTIASYVTSVQGFVFRRLGKGKTSLISVK